ncbi:MAG: MarR family transcriptional regulator [Firmicutes bacterium]|nr:MarR family transcriptional regulator [Bacillota bacterium]
MQAENKTDKYDVLRLDHQLCFPLYACAKEVVRRYKPFLDEIGLTYTQYIAMMVLWEKKQVTVKELGESLFLDSGTLTPLLKKMEQKQLLTRTRSKEDERVLLVTITEEGEALKEKAVNVPTQLMNCITIDPEDAEKLYELLYKALGGMA